MYAANENENEVLACTTLWALAQPTVARFHTPPAKIRGRLHIRYRHCAYSSGRLYNHVFLAAEWPISFPKILTSCMPPERHVAQDAA